MGTYVDIPRDLQADLEELEIELAGHPRGPATDALVAITVTGSALGASADLVTVLMGRAEITRLARRLWGRVRNREESTRVVLNIRRDSTRLTVSFELSGPDTELAAEAFVQGMAGAFTAVLEEQRRDQ